MEYILFISLLNIYYVLINHAFVVNYCEKIIHFAMSFWRSSWGIGLSLRQNRDLHILCSPTAQFIFIITWQCDLVLISTPVYQDVTNISLQRCQKLLALKNSIFGTCCQCILLAMYILPYSIIKFLIRAEAKRPGAARLCYVLPCVLCFYLCCANFVQNSRDSPSWSELPAWQAGLLAKSLGV